MKEKISFITIDSIKIVGDYYDSEKQDAPAIILLHMMPAVKESWKKFALKLQSEGFRVLAIDLRGHGESLDKDEQKLNFREFNDEEHRDSYKDIEAAVKFLKEQGSNKLAIAGASIGANLAIWYQADHPEIKASIPLSAGYNYKGIKTKPLVQKLKDDQYIYFVGATLDLRADQNNCGQVAKDLYKISGGQKKIKVYEDSETHGTNLFNEDPSLINNLVDWLKHIYK